jgi:sugar-specific transcriptional regulator TrmB
MKKITEFLKKLDFSETEAKLYITLLQKGSMTVSELAEKAKLNRTATYGHIYRLLEKGVISRSKGVSNKVIANPPEQLHYLVEEKLSAANILKEQLFPVVTTLNTSFMRLPSTNEADVRHFKGRTGIKAIYEDALKAPEVRSYFNPIEIRQYLPENVDLFVNALERKPKMKIYEIVEDSPTSRDHIEVSKITDRHFWKFLPSDVKLTSNDILIYDGKVAIINLLGEDNFNGSILENRDYYNNSKQLFDVLWRLLPEPGPPFSK